MEIEGIIFIDRHRNRNTESERMREAGRNRQSDRERE